MNDGPWRDAGFRVAPSWALDVGFLGKGLIIAALIAFIVSVANGAMQAKQDRRVALARWGFLSGAACLFGAFACLALLFVADQFEFEYVGTHSWRDTALPYKVAAVWAGQQGSFLLWACTSALFGVLSHRSTGAYRRWFLVTFSTFLGSLCAILAFETPFKLIEDSGNRFSGFMPSNGVGLVPSLQNYWVVIHPPTIFLGFGSLTVMFAYAVSAMLTGDLRSWAPMVRPWALVSLSILGLGLVMGGLWAYETQGWGGFWAWDPVENVSFVPWLMVVALVHGLMVQIARKRWFATNALLAGSPFLLFVYGTFLTRSGYLDKFSVHSFAQMDRTALWVLLVFLLLGTAGFLALWTLRGLRLARAVSVSPAEAGSPREVAFAGGAILISLLSLSIAVGMSIPFFCGMLGTTGRVVDEPLYHQVVVWFFVPAMVLMGTAPFLSWRKMDWRAFGQKVSIMLAIAAMIDAAAYIALRLSGWSSLSDASARIDLPLGLSVPRIPWVMFMAFLAAIAVAGNAIRVAELFKRSKLGVGGFVAHIGVAITLAGLILSRGLERQQQVLVMEGTPGDGLGYTIRYDRMTSDPHRDNANKVVFNVASRGGNGEDPSFEARASYFFTPGERGAEAFTSPAIQHSLSHDLYLSLQTPLTDLWDEPQTLTLDVPREGEGVSITFLGIVRHGHGDPGHISYGARLRVVEDGRAYYGEPQTDAGGHADSPVVSPSLRATFIGMGSDGRSIQLQMPYTHLVFPIELYYKPFTMLVWIGIAVMTGGGLLAAFYRRPAGIA